MEINSIELQVISRLLTTDSIDEINTLCSYDLSYYSTLRPHIEFILDHRRKYGKIPDTFTFLSRFPEISDEHVKLVRVNESVDYLTSELVRHKKHLLLLNMINKLSSLGVDAIDETWDYISSQCDLVNTLDFSAPLDLVKDADIRAQQILDFNKQERIPTGFAEIDKLMYGGLSTIEELFLIVARTNTGKSWICAKMMESAQSHGFPTLYYSPEMQAAFLGTRFDTWKKHFQNSQIYQGNYTPEYKAYVNDLKNESTSAFILEDKDIPSGVVNIPALERLVERNNIKLLIVDGLSYLEDSRGSKGETDVTKYKNLCNDLFRLSKKYHCAIVVAVQANRETKNTMDKDDKGTPFPNLYNIEGSDHPGRIATNVMAIRQIFDKHALDVKFLKSRYTQLTQDTLSYAWDVNTGNMQFLPGGSSSNDTPTATSTPAVNLGSILPNTNTTQISNIEDELVESDIEF